MDPVLSEKDTPTVPLVLLVEDYEPNILVAGVYLENSGYDFDVARSGEEALAKFNSADYYAILMDVQMPRMSGLDATRLIRNHEETLKKKRTVIIGMTAYAMSGDRQMCLDSGMDDYISKPVSQETLKEKLDSYRLPSNSIRK